MDKFLRPDRFDGDSAILSTGPEWEHWKRTFVNFISTAQASSAVPNDLSDNIKLQLLINHVSPRVYRTFSDCTTYDASMTALDAIYVKPKNIITARHILATRRQHPGETIDCYLQVLKQLAKECAFKAVDAETNMKENVRGAFIAGIISTKIRERLLENLTLSLDEAYNKALSLEMAENNSQNFILPAVSAISQNPSVSVQDQYPEAISRFQTTAATAPKIMNTSDNKPIGKTVLLFELIVKNVANEVILLPFVEVCLKLLQLALRKTVRTVLHASRLLYQLL